MASSRAWRVAVLEATSCFAMVGRDVFDHLRLYLLRPLGRWKTVSLGGPLFGSSILVTSLWLATSRSVFCALSLFCLPAVGGACATFRFERKWGWVLPVGNKDRVCIDSDNICPACRRKADSSLEPRPRAQTRILQSTSWGTSFNLSLKFGSSSQLEADGGFKSSPKLLCWRTSCISAGDVGKGPLAVSREEYFLQSRLIFLKYLFLNPQLLSDSANESLNFPFLPNYRQSDTQYAH